VEPEQPEPEQRDRRRLNRGHERKRDRVPGQEIELRDRHRHQSLQRSRRPLAQHRHRGDDEHGDEGKESEQRRADVLEDRRTPEEDLLEQHLEEAGDADDQHDRARISAQLAQNAYRRRRGCAQRHAPASIR
jgi:hypothetical protein